ncbi:hypothetical protein Tco_0940568 [Tanacetum coccineum]|uniref:Uncharacterized protein n=1 Tax=Tanacetum coccineum TaxID=301880 RepID=A0ABQ5DP94_9ASTR
MTHEEVKELVTRRVAEEIEDRKAARTLEPLIVNGGGEKGNRGNMDTGMENHGMEIWRFHASGRVKALSEDFLNGFGRLVELSITRTIGVEGCICRELGFETDEVVWTLVSLLRNEFQKMESVVMVPDEEDRVERFIGGLPDNI